MNNWPRQPVIFLVDWMYGNLPLIGSLLQGMRPIYVYTKKARWKFLNRRKQIPSRDIITASLERLQQGCSLGIFPEGTRNRHPWQLKRGRLGVGEIALRSQTPVLPVGIDFSGRRQRGQVPLFSRIILRFGEPLHFPRELAIWRQAVGHPELAPAGLRKIRLQLGAQITHRIMVELAQLSGKAYPFRQPLALTPGLWHQPELDPKGK